MDHDLINKAREAARQLQQTVNEAVAKGSEQAQPLIADAVSKGVQGSQAGLAALAESARRAIHLTAKAVSEATAPKPPTPPGSPPEA